MPRMLPLLLAVALLCPAAALLCPVTAPAEDALPPAEHPDTTDWTPLFDHDLSNAEFPKGVWTFEDGVLTASEDRCIWTAKQYDDFVLDLEFKLEPGTNSGVFVYNSDPKNWISYSVEVQILDDGDPHWADVAPTWKCASFFGHKAPTSSAVKKPGRWNRMTITCRDQRIDVLLNGEAVNQIDLARWTSTKMNPDGSEIPEWYKVPWAEIPTHGRVGLQGKHGNVPIYFRNLKIRELE